MLLSLDPEAVAAFARRHGKSEPPSAVEKAVEKAIEKAMQAANERLSRVEQIKRYAVLDGGWEPGGDELTPTLKLRRKAITAKYATEIESLYQ